MSGQFTHSHTSWWLYHAIITTPLPSSTLLPNYMNIICSPGTPLHHSEIYSILLTLLSNTLLPRFHLNLCVSPLLSILNAVFVVYYATLIMNINFPSEQIYTHSYCACALTCSDSGQPQRKKNKIYSHVTLFYLHCLSLGGGGHVPQ
jgi:hypothetical protein